MKKWVIVLIIFLISIPLVFAAPPKVKLTVTPISGDSPLLVSYDENSGDKTITNYSYDFGNGDIQYGKTGNYSYGFGGEYNLTLTVKNSLGETALDFATITVKSASEYVDKNTTFQTVISGSSELTNLIAGKDPYEKSIILANKTDKDLKPVKFPFTYKIKNSEIQFDNYCCKLDEGLCGYWISAYRIIGGQRVPVYTDSPVWISPPPFEVTVSESYALATNIITTTVKEDLRGAITSKIQRMVDLHPLGTPVTREYKCSTV
jgi:PKD repeat protein